MRRNWKTLQLVLEAAEADEIDERLCALAEQDRTNESLGEKSTLERDFIGHLWLAADADLILGVDVGRIGFDNRFRVSVTKDARLTMQGHDVLDGLRSKRVLEMIKETMTASSVPPTVELIKAVISHAARKAVSTCLS